MYIDTCFISRDKVANVGPDSTSSKRVLISINSPPWTIGSSPVVLQPDAWSRVLKLEFHDCDADGRGLDGRIHHVPLEQRVFFNESFAVQILRFLREHETEHEHVYVHCEGGISRSAGVAKFIAQIYGLPFPGSYPLYNRHVFSTLLNTYHLCLYGEGPLSPSELPASPELDHRTGDAT